MMIRRQTFDALAAERLKNVAQGVSPGLQSDPRLTPWATIFRRSAAKTKTVRAGFSLLEVLLSMAIFLIALIGISELINISARRAFDISQVNKADQLLEDRMNAVVGGSVSISGQSETAFDQDP